MGKPRILHINCNYMDSWLHQNMVNTLEKNGMDNQVFVPVHNINGHSVKPEDYVNVSPCFRKWDRLIYHHKQRKICRQLCADYDMSKISLVHAYTLFTDGNAARWLSKKYGIPYVVAVRNTDVNVFFRYMIHLRKLGLDILRDASAVFFLSDTYKKQVFDKHIPKTYHQEIEKKTYIIPNGIDEFWHKNLYEEKKYAEIEKQLQEKRIKVVYAGGIDKNKNIRLTIQALESLRREGWSVDFTVVGKIRSQRIYKSIKEHVHYLKERPKEQLIEVYRNSDIFIMPSHAETFGLVYVEAMTQGLPVIYTRGQGFDGQFQEGVVGYAVSDKDAEDIKRAVLCIVDNYREVSCTARLKSNKFEWNSICSLYRKVYEEIIKPR